MSPATDKATYSAVSDDDNESLPLTKESLNDCLTLSPKRFWERDPPRFLWLGQVALLATSIMLFVVAYTSSPSEAECTKLLFPYSPALEAVEWHEEDFRGIFHQPSPYRGKPTPELEENWRLLWDFGGFDVPMDKLHLLNKSTEESWQHTPEEFGGGVAAMMWGFHQLHCLNIIRQATYKEVYEQDFPKMPEMFDGPDYLVRMHLDHCIELLRIDLMCQADTTPYLVFADQTAPVGLRADFSSHHKCRNFEKIQQWNRDNLALE